jgi:hypothetical protein
MPKLQQSWVRSQHPPTQWKLRGGRWSSGETMLNTVNRKKFKNPPLRFCQPTYICGLVGRYDNPIYVEVPARQARNRIGIGLSYRPDRLHEQAKSIPGLLKSLKISSKASFLCNMFCYVIFSSEIRKISYCVLMEYWGRMCTHET